MSTDKKIEKIITLAQRDDSVDAPEESIKWAKNLFLTRAAQPGAGMIKKVLAVLQIDLLPGRAVFGERSAAGAQGRQMFFEAGEFGVDLRVTKSSKGLNVRGQILGDASHECTVRLKGGDSDHETTTNDQGEFRLDKIKPGDYNLSIRCGGTEIVIESISLT